MPWSASLLAGLLLGLRHALDPDHLVTVSTLAAGRRRAVQMVGVCALWAAGHGLSLCALALPVVLLGRAIPPAAADLLEGMAGLLMIALGAWTGIRHWRMRVHAHPHGHPGGEGHVHFHAHSPGNLGSSHAHWHQHVPARSLRALGMGAVHGLAGSGAAAAMALAATGGSSAAVAAFFLGMNAGVLAAMLAVGAAIALPLGAWRRAEALQQWAGPVLSAACAAIGFYLVVEVLR